MHTQSTNVIELPVGVSREPYLTPASACPDVTLKNERLPFTVRLVHNEDQLRKAVQIRHLTYAKHLPALAASLRNPEHTDFEEGVVILLAESKLDGSPIGTMRIQTNQYDQLKLEQSVVLPKWMQGRTLAEATRLGVHTRAGRLIKSALSKAFYLYCVQAGIEWMVIAGRAPVDRDYDRLMFEDVYPGLGYIPLKHAGNVSHRIMSLKVDQVYSKWERCDHPLFKFFFHTRHDDIDIGMCETFLPRQSTRRARLVRGQE